MARLLANHRLNLVLSVTFMSLLGFPIVSPALPSIREAFSIPLQEIGWVMSAFALPALVFMPLAGIWGDRYGKKRILVPSLFLFAVTGSACAFAPNAETLYVLRFLQGIGASVLSSFNVALVGDLYERSERARVTGYVGALQNVGSGCLPLIGGALAGIAWFYPFYITLLGFPVGLYVILCLDGSGAAPGKRGREFLGHAGRHLLDRPLLELVFLTGGFIFIGFGAFVTFMPLYMKDTFATPEFLIGLVMAARAVSGTVLAAQFGWLTRRFSYRVLVVWSFLALAFGMAIVPLAPNHWVLMVSAFCYGGAFGVARTAVQVLVLHNAPDDLRATFSAANSLAMRIAQVVAPVAAGLFLGYASFTAFFLTAAGLGLFMAFVALNSVSLRPESTKGS